MKILARFDLFILRRVLEPILHKFQRRTGKDNFWVEEFVVDCMSVMFVVYSICVVVMTQHKIFGSLLIVGSVVFWMVFSASLYEKLSKGEKKHPLRMKAEDVRQRVLQGARNPLEYTAVGARILLNLELFGFVLCGVTVFSMLPEIIIYVNTVIIFLSCIILSIYIGNCTPLPPQAVKKKEKKISVQLASAES